MRNRRGASVLEFAMMLPILATIVGGVVDLGWYLHQCQMAAQAVREGAHLGSSQRLDAVPNPGDAAEDRVRDALARMGMDPDLATVTVHYENLMDLGSCDTDDTLFVSLEMPFTPAIGIVPLRPMIRSDLATLMLYADCLE